MATIVTRKRKDGSPSYLVKIVRKRKGATVSENRTFHKLAEAKAWARLREAELDKPGAIEHVAKADNSLADAIDAHLKDFGSNVGKTKAACLKSLKEHPIASMNCVDIRSEHIVTLAAQIAERGAQPQTVQNYLSHLQTVFAVAPLAYGHKLNPQAMKDALFALRRTRKVAKSNKRERRPTLAELDRLLTFFTERQERVPHSAPMARILLFALFSTRRLEEITRLRWADLEPPHDGQLARVLVRDMKNPGQKIGNNVWCDLPPEAVAAIDAQRETSGTGERIFPYTVDAIGAAFTRACKVLGIEDLHLHDLRHEGVSRLFEMGWNVPQTAAVSGHRSWASLQRYSQFRKVGDRYQGWPWLTMMGGKSAHSGVIG
jgi:integrase